MHVSEDRSLNAYAALKRKFRNIEKTLGDSLAVGDIEPEHGRCTEPDKYGHFDLHEYAGTNLSQVFQVIRRMP